MGNMVQVRFFSLAPGAKFWFDDVQYIKVHGPAERDESYAINLLTFRITYFAASERGLYQAADEVTPETWIMDDE